jgi:hypothetical protein
MGFITGTITIKTSEFIGFTRMNIDYVRLVNICQKKDNYKPNKRLGKYNINEPTLF